MSLLIGTTAIGFLAHPSLDDLITATKSAFNSVKDPHIDKKMFSGDIIQTNASVARFSENG